MTTQDWPEQVAGNEFGLAKLDPETPLTLKVVTWSSVFGEGGSVAIEGYDAYGKKHYQDFGRINKKFNGSVAAERKHLETIVSAFNLDLANNWRDMINRARADVMAHWEDEAKKARAKLAKARKGVFA